MAEAGRLQQMKAKEKIIIYTDGGSRGNPGPAAVGYVITDAKGAILKSAGETLGRKTNNEAEYEAVIRALKKLKALVGKEKTKSMAVEIRADSELLVRQLNHEYKIESETTIPLFIQIWNLILDFGSISFTHVPREKNREADRMVNQALDQESAKLF